MAETRDGNPTADGPVSTEFQSEPEPVATGTVFLMGVLLVLIFGVWGVMYFTLLSR
jgi:hypothetical protein